MLLDLNQLQSFVFDQQVYVAVYLPVDYSLGVVKILLPLSHLVGHKFVQTSLLQLLNAELLGLYATAFLWKFRVDDDLRCS